MALKSSLIAAILSMGFVSGQDPTAQFKVNVFTVKNVGNPYFDDVSTLIHSSDTISIIIPVKKELPDNLMMKSVCTFAGIPVGEFDIPLCEAFKDEIYGKRIVAKGIPKGIFPTACPVKPNANFEISRFKIENTYIPPGIPDGDVVSEVYIYEPEKDPFVSIHFEGTLSHKLPGLDGFGR